MYYVFYVNNIFLCYLLYNNKFNILSHYTLIIMFIMIIIMITDFFYSITGNRNGFK